MSDDIRVPERRTCVDCGRVERWEADVQNWVVADDEVGRIHCIHSWDITGEFTPVARN